MLVRIVGRDERKVKGKTIIHRNRSDRLLKKTTVIADHLRERA